MPANLRNGGLQPQQNGSGTSSGMLTELAIANSHGTSIFIGDPVLIHTDGYLQKHSGTSLPVKGILMGLKTEGQSSYVPAKYYVASTAVAPKALVLTDPSITFEAQFNGAATVADIGANFAMVQGSGDTSTGLSTTRIDASTRSAVSGSVKLLSFSTRPDNAVGDAYPIGVFKFNLHQETQSSET
jgi:hypothetical protein